MRDDVRLRGLQRTLRALAAVPIATGAASALLGSAIVPGAGDVGPGTESELRFYAVWWIGAGLALAWIAPRAAEATTELRVLCGLLALGGCSRLLAAAQTGPPPAVFVVLAVVEVVLAVVLVTWQARVLRAGRAAG